MNRRGIPDNPKIKAGRGRLSRGLSWVWMRGFLPADANDRESSFAKTSAGEILVRANNPSYEAAMYFNKASLQKIFYRDKVRGEILVFYLGNFFKKRAYPQTLKIEHSRTNDHLTLAFRGLRVTGARALGATVMVPSAHSTTGRLMVLACTSITARALAAVDPTTAQRLAPKKVARSVA